MEQALLVIIQTIGLIVRLLETIVQMALTWRIYVNDVQFKQMMSWRILCVVRTWNKQENGVFPICTGQYLKNHETSFIYEEEEEDEKPLIAKNSKKFVVHKIKFSIRNFV